MQIAFCLYKYFPHGGIQRDLMKMARECLGRGHSVRVYVSVWNAPSPVEDIEVVVVPARGLASHRRYARFAGWLCEHLRSHPVDLLVGMNKMPGLDVYYAGDSCYAEKARRQRSILYRLLPRYRHFERFERAVFQADSDTEILTIADNEVPLFRKHYATPEQRFHSLPPGIDRDRAAGDDLDQVRGAFRREFAIGDRERLLLFVGSGFIKKGLDRALLGVQALPAELAANTRLMVVGNDNAEPFRRMALRLGIAPKVQIFPGRDDIPRFMHASDGLLLPAYDETAGMVILEAMIAGLPALVTQNCGYAQYLAGAEAGLVTPVPFDQQVFNAQLRELLTSARRARWRENGLMFAHNPNIYRLAEVAVDHLERFANARSRPVTGDRLRAQVR